MLNAVKKHEASIKFEAVSVSPGHGVDHTAFLAASNGIYQSPYQRASWQPFHLNFLDSKICDPSEMTESTTDGDY